MMLIKQSTAHLEIVIEIYRESTTGAVCIFISCVPWVHSVPNRKWDATFPDEREISEIIEH